MNKGHLIQIDDQGVQINIPVRRVEVVNRLHEEGEKLVNSGAGIAALRDPVFCRMGSLADQLDPIERALDDRHYIGPFASRIQTLARSVIDCCDEDFDAALAQPYLNCHHPYSVLHHILIAVIVAVISKSQEWSEPDRLSLTCAALTHDLGVIAGRSELAHAGPLTATQRAFVYGHPLNGVELLKGLGVNDPLWLESVLQHHETIDGSGYPSGICVGLHSSAALMSVSDGFAAMMRPRAYRNRKLGNDIIEDLRAHSGTLYSPVMVEAIADNFGNYHAGSIVRLANKDMAVVRRHRQDKPAAPDILVIAGYGDKPLSQPYAVDSADPEFAIEAALHPEICLSFRNIVHRSWGV